MGFLSCLKLNGSIYVGPESHAIHNQSLMQLPKEKWHCYIYPICVVSFSFTAKSFHYNRGVNLCAQWQYWLRGSAVWGWVPDMLIDHTVTMQTCDTYNPLLMVSICLYDTAVDFCLKSTVTSIAVLQIIIKCWQLLWCRYDSRIVSDRISVYICHTENIPLGLNSWKGGLIYLNCVRDIRQQIIWKVVHQLET